MAKFTPTSKEKWVIDRLKRDGWRLFRDDYNEQEICFYRPFHQWQQWDWVGVPWIYINRQKGVWVNFRNRASGQERIHHNYFLSWPTLKNWGEIDKACRYMQAIGEATERQTIEAFCDTILGRVKE